MEVADVEVADMEEEADTDVEEADMVADDNHKTFASSQCGRVTVSA